MKIEDLKEWNLMDNINTLNDLAYYIQALSEEKDSHEEFYWEVMDVVERVIKEKV